METLRALWPLDLVQDSNRMRKVGYVCDPELNQTIGKIWGPLRAPPP